MIKKDIAKNLDVILQFLNNTNAPLYNWIHLLQQLELNIDNEKTLFSILESDKYIDVQYFIGDSKMVVINNNGRAFINRTSYLENRKSDILSNNHKQLGTIINYISKIVAIIGVFSTIYFMRMNNTKDLTIKNLNDKINKITVSNDSLSLINKTLIHNIKQDSIQKNKTQIKIQPKTQNTIVKIPK